jgi:SAM-dependent methyltransferase
MNPRAFIKRSIVLTSAYYLFDDWRAGRRLARGDLSTRSGSRHATLDINASLNYIDRIHDDYLTYAACESLPGVIAEIGPGDNFGVGMCFLAGGAEHVHGIDRYRPARDDTRQRAVYEALSARDGLAHLFDGTPCEENLRGVTYHAGQPAETFFRTSELRFDAIVSRAVMEHLFDPIAALDDMAAALNPGGIMIHRVDLRDHGMFAGHHPLTFLTIPGGIYRSMTRGAGRPNRVLIDAYRAWLARSGLVGELKVSRLVGVADEIAPAPWDGLDSGGKNQALASVRAIRPRLARAFNAVADEDLAVAGLVLVARKPGP